MSDKKAKVPQLRFAGFVGDWEERKVTETGKIFIGLVTTMTKHYTDTGTLLIRNSDIKDGRFQFAEKPIYLEKSFAEKNSTRMHQIGDVITVHTGDVGTSAVITENEKNTLGFATIVTRPNKQIIDSNYLSTYLNTDQHKKIAVAVSTGDGRTNYNLRDYFNLIVPIPILKEQKKISTVVMVINNLITLQQRRLDQLASVKKTMLAKMFPKDGANVPEIRFAGFTGAWEERKLVGEVELFSGLTYSPNNVVAGNGTLVLRSSNVKNGEITSADNVYVDPSIVNSCNVKDGDVIVVVRNGSRSLIGKHAQIKGDMSNTVIGAFMTGIRSVQPDFINALLNTQAFDIEIEKNLGATINQITNGAFQKMKFMFPNVEEQNRIGKFFTQLDTLLTLHQRELNALKTLKQSLLQQLFV